MYVCFTGNKLCKAQPTSMIAWSGLDVLGNQSNWGYQNFTSCQSLPSPKLTNIGILEMSLPTGHSKLPASVINTDNTLLELKNQKKTLEIYERFGLH